MKFIGHLYILEAYQKIVINYCGGLNNGPPSRGIPKCPEPANVALQGKMAFADAIKLMILR